MLHPHNPDWIDKFTEEEKLIKKLLGTIAIDIQHIGSTAIPHIMAKPIIDIAVLIPTLEEAHLLVPVLEQHGYLYEKEKSSQERFYFVKGDPEEYHLSLAQPHTYSYWKRQILFRDYLKLHPEVAKEYEKLKLEALTTNASNYLRAKGPFIEKVLELAEMGLTVL